MMNQIAENDSKLDYRPGSTFFVANLNLVDQADAPLNSLVTEWVAQADSACAPTDNHAPTNGAAPRSSLSFSTGEVSPTRLGALTLLLRFAREQVTQLSAFLARIDDEILLTEDSETMSAARLRPDGAWEVRCSKCKGVVRFSKTARDIACDKCRRVLIRDANSVHERGEPTKSTAVYCLSDLPTEFAERAGPDSFLLAFVQRGDNEFSPAGVKPDAGGKYATIASHELPGQRHPTRHSALTAMRESVHSRLARLSKQRARIAREIT